MSFAAASFPLRRRAALAGLATLPAMLLAGCAAERPAAGGRPSQPVRLVFFEDDSLTVPPAAMDVIQDAARAARANPQAPIRVLGFIAPDPQDAPTVLQARLLSRRRADRVVAELMNLDIPADRIQVLGRGQAPVAEAAVEARRVEIHIGAK
jgi:outer membrane protein OmpA-like peptidoglycan-associated protein